MKKKFVKVMFFGALALSTTVSFIGCKNYDDDIKTINSRLDANDTKLAEIQKTLESGQWVKEVKAISNGIQVVLGNGKTYDITNGTKGADGVVYTIGEDGYWYKGSEKTQWKAQGESPYIKEGNWWIGNTDMNVPASGGTASAPYIKEGNWWIGTGDKAQDLGVKAAADIYTPNADGYWYINGRKTEDRWKAEGTITAAVNEKGEVVLSGMEEFPDGFILKANTAVLSSLVFEPQSYMGGIEAMKAISMKYNQWSVKTSDATPTFIGEIWQRAVTTTTYSPKIIAYYHVNPSNINEGQIVKNSVQYVADDKEAMTRSQKFNPRVESYELVTKTINGKEARMMKVVFGVTSEQIQSLDASKISTLALQVSVKMENEQEARVITSDYAALYKTNWSNLVLAFKDKTRYNIMRHGHLYGADNQGSKISEALDAIGNTENFILTATTNTSNPKTLDLKPYFTFDYVETADKAGVAGTEKTFEGDLEDLGLTIEFAKSNYISGNNKTQQNSFFTLEDGVVTSTVYGDAGVAAVDRMPLVRVMLKEKATGKIVNAGWVKIKIVKDDIAGIEVNYPKFSDIYLGCNDFVGKTDVEFMNKSIYNTIGLTKEEFHSIYTLNTAKTNANGKGTVREIPDAQGTQTILLEWTISQTEIEAATAESNFTKKIYYSGTGRKDVIVVMNTGKVFKPKGSITNSIKNPIYWDEAFKFIKMNVETVDNNNSCDFKVDLLNTFVGNKISVNDLDPQFIDFRNLTSGFVFDKSNTNREFTVNGVKYKLTVAPGAKALKVGAETIATIDDADAARNGHPSFTLNNNSAIAKTLLNKVGHLDIANTFYATFAIEAENNCNIKLPLSNYTFDAKLLRPVDVNAIRGAFLTDGITNGDTKALATLVELSDWRDKKFSTNDNGVNNYDYYGVTSVRIGSKNEMLCNMRGKFEKLTDVTSNIDVIQDITGASVNRGNFGTITYKNIGNVASDYTLRVPVKITHKWGTTVEYIDILIKATINN